MNDWSASNEPMAGPPKPQTGPVSTRPSGAIRWGWPLTVGIFLAAMAALAASHGDSRPWHLVFVAAGLLSLVIVAVGQVRAEHRRWFALIHQVVDQIDDLAADPSRPLPPPCIPELSELSQAVEMLRRRIVAHPQCPPQRPQLATDSSADIPCISHFARPELPALTRSGLFEPPIGLEGVCDPMASAEFATGEMICRLEPRSLRWIGASPAAVGFLGWSIEELRIKSFLEIVHPDHRDLAREQLHAALIRGEAHGLIYRIADARGEARAVEINVGVRYAPDMTVTHLRAHLTDVTDRLRAGKELRRRTKELTQANQQLRRINRELQELKDRYSDLYQNAPAMYFTLDECQVIRDCNDTMLRALAYRRRDLVGKPFSTIFPESHRDKGPEVHERFLRDGFVEFESRWVLADGSSMDVFVTASIVRDDDGKVASTRCVAQDVTARRALEAQLREKHERLARANAELSGKNRELDEFTYVVSHDLQEPIRTLIAFSDFLQRDCGDKLDDAGREHLKFIVEASRRMRSLIRDLLTLGRAGRVAGDPEAVELAPLIEQIRRDMCELIRTRGAAVRVVGDLPTLWGDRDRIGQLFANLISNGLKYNRRDRPTVEIGAIHDVSESPLATLYVRDDGIGIDPKFHGKIFQIFRRLHTREEYEGTGAGLAICQKVAQAHGGRIWVESTPGLGSTFYVTLPRAASAPAAAALAESLAHAP